MRQSASQGLEKMAIAAEEFISSMDIKRDADPTFLDRLIGV
jgi:hypothetical protein